MKGRLSRWLLNVLRVFKILSLLFLCSFVLWRTLLYVEVNRRLARIRTAGLPTSGTELNDWRPSVPDSENGALVLTQAFDLTRTFPDSRSKEVVKQTPLERTNVWPKEIHALVAEYLEMNSEALGKAREAFQFSRFRYPADFSYGPDTEMPHLALLKDMARTVALQTALAAEKGRANEWTESAGLLLNLATTLDEEPVLISLLVRNAIIRMAVNTIERSLSRFAPDDESCRRLQDAFAATYKTNLLPLVFVGERAMMIPPFRLSWSEIKSFDQTDEDGNRPRERRRFFGKPAPFVWLAGFFERDLNFYLQTMDKSISLASLPMPENLVLTNQFEEASQVARSRYYLLSGMVLPAFSRVAAREASTQTQLNLARTALGIERFRHSHDRLPQDLEELAPQFLDRVPTDPFDGAPVRYRLRPKGYVIYSVDSDGQDDGGREKPERKKSTDRTSYDLTFTVER